MQEGKERWDGEREGGEEGRREEDREGMCGKWNGEREIEMVW